MAEQKDEWSLKRGGCTDTIGGLFIKNKKAIIGTVVAVIIIIAGVVMYKNLYADPREEKAQAALFKGKNTSKQTLMHKHWTVIASVLPDL